MIRPALAAAASLPLLAACSAIGSGAGAIVGLASGVGSANPVLGTAVGLGTKAGVDALVRYVSRKRQQGEQDAIADRVGALPVGGTAGWRIEHTIPVGDEAGEVRVMRLIPNALAPCKEAVFTLRDGETSRSYTTTACLQGAHWKWAEAEPATERWGFLQ